MTVLSADGLVCMRGRASLRRPARSGPSAERHRLRRVPARPAGAAGTAACARCHLPQTTSRSACGDGGQLHDHRRRPHRRSQGARRSSPIPADPLMLARLRRPRGRFLGLCPGHGSSRHRRRNARRPSSASRPAVRATSIAGRLPNARRTLLEEPALDYLAKDYQSFRRLMVDLIAERNPAWQERLPADLGMTLVELDGLRRRLSQLLSGRGAGNRRLPRHLPASHLRGTPCPAHRLPMEQGRNAATFVHFEGGARREWRRARRATKLVSRDRRPADRRGRRARFRHSSHGRFRQRSGARGCDRVRDYGTVRVIDTNNELRIHTWGDAQCCLARGDRGFSLRHRGRRHRHFGLISLRANTCSWRRC